MKKIKYCPEKFAAYSLMATSFLFLQKNSDAQLVYTDVDPDETYSENGDEYLLDLNNDGTTDFMIQIINFSSAGIFVSGSYSFSGLVQNVFIIPSPGNSIAGSLGLGSYLYPYALNSGSSVGPGLLFQSASLQSMVSYLAIIDYPAVGSVFPFLSYGNWIGVEDKYLGLKFKIGADTHYGWARLDCGADHHSITIKDYVYNATPDIAVVTGITMDPLVGVSFSTNSVAIDESTTDIIIEVTVTEPVDATVNIELNSLLTTADPANDFDYADPSPLIFSAVGPTTASFTIHVNDDLIFEPNEIIVLDILSVSAGSEILSPSTITITIEDNELPPDHINELNELVNVYNYENYLVVELTATTKNQVELLLTDIQGKDVFETKLVSPKSIYNLNLLPDGIYIVQILHEGKIYTKKLHFGSN